MGRRVVPPAVVCGIGLTVAAAVCGGQTQGPLVLRPGASRPAPAEPDPRPAPPVRAEDRGFLQRTAATVFQFSRVLPNFLCRQATSRFISYHNPPRWELQDAVTAEVMYVDGKESYRDVQRNGKPERPEKTGAWSSGEFGTLMLALFHPDTAAEFTGQGDTELDGVPARVYDFEVARRHSRWRVGYEKLTTFPAYTGSVWVDPATFRVLRIEMQARDLPKNFGLDVVEMSVDYGSVAIGDGQYLLTTRSANLACQRGTPICTQNKIEFRDYRKFTSETTIRPDVDEIEQE